ncbi:lipase maturation factor 2-like [Clavelina lepadiformis]|uniref:lipase maturation factor 2-like n=1 Tax=Clavelina lepadiformis TaxID=159417 RepID=UPI00404126C4
MERRDNTARTRDLFLRLMSLVYMFAFASIYVQIPGLYGKNGIMPVHSLIQTIFGENKGKSAESLFLHTPTLLWFMKVDPDLGLEILSLLGVFFSFICILWQKVRIMPFLCILWLLYLSIYKVGETFLWFQWDILLLEAGFLTILVAPVVNRKSDPITGASYHRQLPFFLVKWLLFRLMFASGIVKLTSQCPTWWGLTALNYHYESQCIPTPLAWWAHQSPDAVHQLSVIGAYIIEIAIPFLFISPVRLHRLVAAYAQIFLMILIYLSGNYNFFNIVTVVLCLSLFDDDHLDFLKEFFTFGCIRAKPQVKIQHVTPLQSFVNFIGCLGALGFYGYWIYHLFGYKNGKFFLNFKPNDLNEFMKWVMPYLVALGVVTFTLKAICMVWKMLFRRSLNTLIKFLLILGPSVYILTISMVPFSSLQPGFSGNLWPIAHTWHRQSLRFDLVHSYGLFRRMTGVGGRPEVVLEGSHAENGNWREYHFNYKPGKTTVSPPWVAPHQPRLDWQMWFAALDNYHRNPWLISFMHRLLRGEPDVLKLIDRSKNPFKERPPKLIRAVLYHYHYTRPLKDGGLPKAWWKREFKSIYVPAIQKDDTTALEFLKYHRLMPLSHPKVRAEPGMVETFCRKVRELTEQMSPELLLWSLALTAFFLSLIGSILPFNFGSN